MELGILLFVVSRCLMVRCRGSIELIKKCCLVCYYVFYWRERVMPDLINFFKIRDRVLVESEMSVLTT